MDPNVMADLSEDAIQTLVSQACVIENEHLHNTIVTGNYIVSYKFATLKRHPVPLNAVNS